MNCQKLLQQVIGVMLVVVFSVGCTAPSTTPDSEAPAATSTSDSVIATLTPIPPTPTSESPIATLTPEPPTATPTPVPPSETPTPAFVKPKSGVTLTGEIKVSDIAESATIDLMISEDGISITQVDVTIINVFIECSDVFAGVKREGSIKTDSQEISIIRSIPIMEGAFEINLSNNGKLEGKFNSPTEASGWIHIIESISNGALCDYGEWYWSAKTK